MVSGEQSIEKHLEWMFKVVLQPAIASALEQPVAVRGPVHVLVMSTDEIYSETESLPILFETLYGNSADWKNWRDEFKGVAYSAARISWLTMMSMKDLHALHDGVLYEKVKGDTACHNCGSCHHEGILVVVNGMNPFEWNDTFASMFVHAIIASRR